MRLSALILLAALGACASQPPPTRPAPVVEAPSAHATQAPVARRPPAQPLAPPDPQDDLAWLRERAPGLGELRDGAPALPALLAWVPPGEARELWLLAGAYRCTRAIAERSGDDRLTLSIVASERRARGRRVRSLRPGSAGHLLTLGDGRSRAHEERDGSWVESDAIAVSGGTVVGALSAVEGEVARYDGRPVSLRVTCPVVEMACAAGGSRACRDCARFEVDAQVITGLHSGVVTWAPRGVESTCHEPCPAETSPDRDRAERVVAELSAPWLVGPPGPEGLYQSQATCMAALPPVP